MATEAPSQQEDKDGKANDTQPKSYEPSIPIRIIESPDETQRTRDREAAGDKHDSDDLKAQQKAADAADRAATAAERQVITAWWQVGVGIAGIIALLVTIGFSIRATSAAVQAANSAEDTLKIIRATERAFVFPSSLKLLGFRPSRDWEYHPAGIMSWGYDGTEVTTFIRFHNTSKTPAILTELSIKIYMVNNSKPDETVNFFVLQWALPNAIIKSDGRQKIDVRTKRPDNGAVWDGTEGYYWGDVFVRGTLRYMDTQGNRFVSGFLFTYVDGSFQPNGGSEDNYDRREEVENHPKQRAH
ncbi:hypothetical protein [Mesorhizobium sp. M0323]|uniref:hypothetical protein n=1 Tax=Mesorhizobium sp. M0323 TaxID=2956938 RepID=UPI00333819A5